MPNEKRVFLISVFRHITEHGAELAAVIPIDAHRPRIHDCDREAWLATPLPQMSTAQLTGLMSLGLATTDFQLACGITGILPNQNVPREYIGHTLLTIVHVVTIEESILGLYEVFLRSKDGISGTPIDVLQSILDMQKEIGRWYNPLLSFFSALSLKICALKIPLIVPFGKCEFDFLPNQPTPV